MDKTIYESQQQDLNDAIRQVEHAATIFGVKVKIAFTTGEEELFRKAIEIKGRDNQINQAIEELNELAVELNHFRRPERHTPIEKVVEELVDAQLGIDEMILMFGILPSMLEQVRGEKKQKLAQELVNTENRRFEGTRRRFGEVI